MTVYWYDSFAKSNQSGFGAPNTPVSGVYSVQRGNPGLSIASDEGVLAFVNTTTAGVVQAGSQLIGNSEMLCRVSQGGSTSDLVGVVPRFIDVNNWYTFCIGDTPGDFQLIKDVAGSFSVVGTSFAFVTTVGSFYWIRARIQGAHFLGKIWADGTPEPNAWGIDTTDSSLTANGTFGLTCAPQSGNNVKVDGLYVIDYLNSEALTISDAFTGGVTTLPVEALTATDSPAIASTTQPVEALSIVESTAIGLAANTTEALVLSDQGNANTTIAFVEGLSLFDQGGTSGSMSVVETLVLSDSVWGSSLFAPIDALVLSDALVSMGTVALTDALIAGDVWSASLAAQWIDALSISDSVASTATLVAMEQLPIVDQLLVVDASLWTEQLTALDLWVISDVIVVAPAVNVTMFGRKGTITLYGRKGTITLYGRKN